jgi:hypothetical protein
LIYLWMLIRTLRIQHLLWNKQATKSMLGEHLKPFGEIWELELINVSVLDLFVNFLVLGTESVAISFEEHLILEFFLEGRVLDVRLNKNKSISY